MARLISKLGQVLSRAVMEPTLDFLDDGIRVIRRYSGACDAGLGNAKYVVLRASHAAPKREGRP